MAVRKPEVPVTSVVSFRGKRSSDRCHRLDEMAYNFPTLVPLATPQLNPAPPNINFEIERIVRTAIKILSRVEGPLYLRDLTREVGNIAMPNARLSERQMFDLLRNYPNNFTFSKSESNDEDIVGAITKLSLCKEHCSKYSTCPGLPICSGLHVCKFYLLSNSCRFSKSNSSCVYGHDLTNQHNKYLLNQNLMDHLTINELRYLFRTIKSRSKTTLPNICKFYNVSSGCRSDENGKGCPYIHICRHYILDQCRFGKNCKRNHNVNHQQVREILSKHGISTQRTPKEVLADLRDAQMNDFDDSQSTGSQSSGATGQSRMSGTERMMSNMSLGSVENSDGEDEADNTLGRSNEAVDLRNTDICIYHLRGRCAFGRGCQKHHRDLPYQWQYQHVNDKSIWQDVNQDSNIDLELNYCDADKSECYLKLRPGEVVQVNFDTMQGEALGQGFTVLLLRRLSTPSTYEEKFSPLATSWKWFWLDSDGWKEYGVDSAEGYKAIISSDELEQSFLDNPTGQLRFATLGHEYVMDFKHKVQTNIVYKTERCVRRRPVFVSPADFMTRKRRNTNVKNGNNQAQNPAVAGPLMHPLMSYIPQEWDLDRSSNNISVISDHYRRVQILGQSSQVTEECRFIKDLFYKTMPSTAKVTNIERVQNGELWMNFVSKNEKMKRKKKMGAVNEMRLFHGTTREYVDAICRQGFDFRFSGKTSGNMYGKGSYFAKNAKYADHYTDYQTEKEMFLARVLVGDFAKGENKFVRPPPKNPADPFELFDSCVDSASNPSIFVIFTFDQVYPEYVIRYTT